MIGLTGVLGLLCTAGVLGLLCAGALGLDCTGALRCFTGENSSSQLSQSSCGCALVVDLLPFSIGSSQFTSALLVAC